MTSGEADSGAVATQAALLGRERAPPRLSEDESSELSRLWQALLGVDGSTLAHTMASRVDGVRLWHDASTRAALFGSDAPLATWRHDRLLDLDMPESLRQYSLNGLVELRTLIDAEKKSALMVAAESFVWIARQYRAFSLTAPQPLALSAAATSANLRGALADFLGQDITQQQVEENGDVAESAQWVRIEAAQPGGGAPLRLADGTQHVFELALPGAGGEGFYRVGVVAARAYVVANDDDTSVSDIVRLNIRKDSTSLYVSRDGTVHRFRHAPATEVFGYRANTCEATSLIYGTKNL